MHKLNPQQARCFLMLHPEAYRVLFAYSSGPLSLTEAAALLCFDAETFGNLLHAAADERDDLIASTRTAGTPR